MNASPRPLSYKAAIAEALAQEMRRDPTVIVYGLDVPDHKRIFGSTANLLEEFGPERCFGTPLSEDAMTGVALGAALNGLRPVHVHIRTDFMLLAMNQIGNMISAYRYMSGGRCRLPLVIRAIIGRGWGQGAQHSKALHGILAHFPGLKVVMPTTPRDVKGILTAAIRDDDPVICIEHRWLYEVVDQVPEEPYTLPLDQPRVMRAGRDLTIVATSWLVVEALHAAQLLERAGISVEVIDTVAVTPLDMTAIYASAARTGRVLVADNDWLYCGFSAELAARISERCWDDLRSPVKRLGWMGVPCPTTRPLEDLFYPNAATMVRACEAELGLPAQDLSGEAFFSWANRFKGPF